VHASVHSLRLASASDLWYVGGGAFQPSTFGHSGRPSNGHSTLATLYDVSGDITAGPRLSIGLYYGHAAGGRLTRSIYPGSGGAGFGCVELLFRF